MLIKLLYLVAILYISFIDGAPEYRFDYKYDSNINGWLKLHVVPATWSDARILCHAEGAVLASPLTQDLQNAILDHVAQEKSDIPALLTGVHSTYCKGAYTSVEGVPLSKLPIKWAPGEPDNFENSESCLTMLTSSNGTMMDVRCTDVFPFVCYKERTVVLNLNVNGCGTYDTEYNFDSRTGKCYKYHQHGRTWPRAYQTCIAEGGHLAVINSEQEFQVLMELNRKYPDSVIFSPQKVYAALGFSDPNDGGSWITIHGTTLKEAGFERWQIGEPNNGTQPVGELCGCMFRGNGNFYDYPCHWPVAFICEKEPHNV